MSILPSDLVSIAEAQHRAAASGDGAAEESPAPTNTCVEYRSNLSRTIQSLVLGSGGETRDDVLGAARVVTFEVKRERMNAEPNLKPSTARWWIVHWNSSYVGSWFGSREHALECARRFGDSFGVVEPPNYETREVER